MNNHVICDRLVLRPEDSVSDEDVGRMLIDEHIFIHCLDTGTIHICCTV
jgi:hypothetical protein